MAALFFGRSGKRHGFTLVEIMIVVFIIAILATLAILCFARARQTSQATVCISHLRHLQDGKERWAMESRKASDDTPAKDDLYPAYVRNWPSCPAGGAYSLNEVGESVTCSVGGKHVME